MKINCLKFSRLRSHNSKAEMMKEPLHLIIFTCALHVESLLVAGQVNQQDDHPLRRKRE